MEPVKNVEFVLFIIRGLPGSGKTTLGNELNAYVIEADQYFMKDGEYKYNSELIGAAHRNCKTRVELAMQDCCTRIAVCNTFSQRWEFDPYIQLAQAYGYRIVEITLTGDTYANLHNVPEETMERMRTRWEN